jgi:hypothetical protein
MDARACYEQFLAALAKRLGLEALSPDARGRLALRVGRHLIEIVCVEDVEEMAGFIRVAPLPGEEGSKERLAALSSLLRGSYAGAGAGGGIISLDEEASVCLTRRYALAGEEGAFLEQFAEQISLADFWLDALEQRRELP